MDDRRGMGHRTNGNASRSLSYSGPQNIPNSRPSGIEMDSTDPGHFKLTRILGEASYQYGKVKDAELERSLAEGEYLKQSQYFVNNPKLRETVESRRSRTERALNLTRTEYAKAARDAEPLLRRLAVDNPSGAITDEETIRKIIRAELKDFVMFKDMDKETTNLERKIQKRISGDMRVVTNQELKGYTRLSDFEKLADQVRGMNVRNRQRSVSSETSREVDHRIVGQAKEVENIKSELVTRTNQQAKEISILKDQINSMQGDTTAQQSRGIQMAPGTKSEDIVKVESALEKAQEVMNDQYVIIHDLQLQVNVVLEGVRILNERVEEYDKRIENLQISTDKFFTEVQAENGRQNSILCQTLDKMHDKLTSEIASKLGEKPLSSPVSAQFGSPRIDPPRTGFAPPSPANINITGQLETQAKAILDLQSHFQKLHPQLANYQRAMSQLVHLPASVQKFCDEVSARIHTYQTDQNAFTAQIKAFDVNIQAIGMSVNQHISDADHNFAETAIHMDTVKKRFAEHRKQLDNLITAWRDTLTTIEQLSSKYEYLREFLSTKMVPTIVQVQKAFPELFVASGNDTINRNLNTEATTQNRLLPVVTDADRNVLMSGRGDGGGGVSNPIEL